MATSDKPGKPAEPGTARSGGSRASPRRKASRPPIIDIAATEVPQDEDGKTHGRKPAAASPEAEAAGGAQASAAEEAAARRDRSTGPAATGGKASSGAGAGNPEPGRSGSPETAPRAGRPAGSPGFSLTAVGGAAAAGALLCLAVLVGLDRAGVLPWRAGPADGVDPAAIEARIASLESRLSGLTARTEPLDGDLAGRVAGIEEDLRAAGEAVGALPGLIEKLDRRLSGFETSLSQTRTTAQTALSGLETIETAVNTIGERAGEAGVVVLSDRQHSLRRRCRLE